MVFKLKPPVFLVFISSLAAVAVAFLTLPPPLSFSVNLSENLQRNIAADMVSCPSNSYPLKMYGSSINYYGKSRLFLLRFCKKLVTESLEHLFTSIRWPQDLNNICKKLTPIGFASFNKLLDNLEYQVTLCCQARSSYQIGLLEAKDKCFPSSSPFAKKANVCSQCDAKSESFNSFHRHRDEILNVIEPLSIDVLDLGVCDSLRP